MRLLLLTLGVAGLALASAVGLSRRAVNSEYVRLEAQQQDLRLSGVAPLLADALGRAGDAPDLDGQLREMAGPLGHELLLLGADGSVRAASTPSLRVAAVELLGADRLSLEERETRAGVVRTRRTVIVGGPRLALRAADGALLGTLFALPRAAVEEPRFVTSVNRSLLLAALGSGALALVLTLALSRRILGPIEALTAAARKMGAGDLQQRVAVASSDEIGELARAFNAMAEGLLRTDALRRTLVTDVAHELRTPLTNLRCQIEALQDGLQAPDGPALASLHEETLLLARLVGDLQDLALAEAGGLLLVRSPLALAEVLDAALLAMRPLAEQRQLSLHGQIAGQLHVDADRERIGQVLRNLLANALTHTPAGGQVTVHARLDGDSVEVVVSDTGSGIAPEHLANVFERFYRADPARARASGGAGLGLAIVKQLVLAHGGRVAVASEPGRGAHFSFWLPRSG